jgi:RecB family endonuclease NucS
MGDLALFLDSAPREASRVPFASETDLHRFLEEHASDILDLKVVGSELQLGASMFKIDILGADGSGRGSIIECKHDLVKANAWGNFITTGLRS